MEFPINKPACTIWEKTTIDRAPAYVRHETGAVYWEDNRGQTTGREEDNSIFLAIPPGAIADGYVPKREDKVLPGSIAEETPPRTALTVMQVKDFRYGSSVMQHIEVTIK